MRLLHNSGNVSGIIKSIQDIMRKDVGVDGDAQRISQLVWMFFLKIYDDRELELEYTEDKYKSPLPEKLRWRNWAKDPEGMTGDALSDFVNLQLFPTLKEKLVMQGEAGKRALVIRNLFEDAYNYMKSGTLMRQVINKICEINFNNTADRHTFGSIYEQILKDLQSAGNAGEFYTPRAVTQFIVNRIDPRLAESVLDPACGTGGFLACTIDHKRSNYVKVSGDEEVLQQSIFGVEKKSLPHMLCTTNMILHGIDTPTRIEHKNTLSRPYTDYTPKDQVDVIITNPPFGGMEEDGIEKNFPANLRTRETADLFMALIVRRLRDGGRAAVVLPDGFLFGEGMKTRLKEMLLQECNLHTIVRLPNGVFAPYTGIKTNLLFFTKGKSTEHVWYYEHPYPDGIKSYNKTKPMRFEEFATEIEWWGNEADGFKARVQNEQAWQVPVADIVARNYNLDIKNPHIGEQVSHDPGELLAQYRQQQTDIASLRDQIKRVLLEAFTSWRGESMSEVVTDNLDLWTSTLLSKSGAGRGNGKHEAYGINKLRELILELAVRGKLVPQETKDEPASELLKRLQINIKSIPVEQYPFPLPKGWEWIRFGDALDFQGGGQPPKNAFSDTKQDGYVQLIQIRDLGERPQPVFIKKDLAAKFCTSEDIMIGRYGASVGKVFWGKDGAYNVALVKIVDEFGIYYNRFLYEFFRCPLGQSFFSGISRSAQAGFNKSDIAGQLMPVCSHAEQHRIVAKVDELMALCDSLKARLIDAQTTQIHLADAIVEQAVC